MRNLWGGHRCVMSAEDDLTEELLSLYRRTGEATAGAYWPYRFLAAVRQQGGLKVAKEAVGS